MTDPRCTAPLGFEDIVDYWAGDLTPAEEDRIDEHVFACALCARALSDAAALGAGIAAVARHGRLHTVVTDTILNRLAADGVRIRTFTPEAHAVIPCAVWEDDDLIVSRIRADLSGVDSVTIVARRESGEEISRLAGIAVHPGQHEILNAFSAERLRALPSTRVLITVTTPAGSGDRTLAEYTLEHQGAFARPHAQ